MRVAGQRVERKRVMSSILLAAFLAALMLVGPTQTPSARAADIAPGDVAPVAPTAAESGWTYELTPYGWLPGIKGEAALFGSPDFTIDVKFLDLLDAIDWGNFPPLVMIYGEVRNDRFGLFADVIHMALEVDTKTPGPVFSSARLNLEITLATVLGFYRIAEEGESHLDVLAGGRLWSVDGNLGLGAGALAGISATDDETWVDPVIGVKGRYGLNDKLFLKGWGMIGGFGASSEFMWDVFGGLGYQFNDRFSATAGWRHVGVDYSHGAFLFDVDIDGPIIEGSFRF
jgi:hypothetical protein